MLDCLPERGASRRRGTQTAIKAEGWRCLLIAGDVRKFTLCQRAVERTVKAFGRLDVLVNNAAFQMHADALEDISDERMDLTLQTNIGGYKEGRRRARVRQGNRLQARGEA